MRSHILYVDSLQRTLNNIFQKTDTSMLSERKHIAIKFSNLYGTFDKHLKGHLQILDVKRRTTSPYLFCPRVRILQSHAPDRAPS